MACEDFLTGDWVSSVPLPVSGQNQPNDGQTLYEKQSFTCLETLMHYRTIISLTFCGGSKWDQLDVDSMLFSPLLEHKLNKCL
jgi:hypothetical protein